MSEQGVSAPTVELSDAREDPHVETIRGALDRLLAQDRYELPHVDAGIAALDTLVRERDVMREALREITILWLRPEGRKALDRADSIARVALARLDRFSVERAPEGDQP